MNVSTQVETQAEGGAMKEPKLQQAEINCGDLHSASDKLTDLLTYVWLCKMTKDDYSLPPCYRAEVAYDA
jgi:hypothetical protein